MGGKRKKTNKATVLARTLKGPHSFATVLVNPTIPALATASVFWISLSEANKARRARVREATYNLLGRRYLRTKVISKEEKWVREDLENKRTMQARSTRNVDYRSVCSYNLRIF